MTFLDKATTTFRAIPNIGVTPDVRPEEAKHIQYINVGFSLMIVINLAFVFQGLADARIPPVQSLAQVSSSILCLLVFLFNRWGRYTTARVYGFLLWYANCLFLFPLSGKSIVDHLFIFVSFGYAFLVFPRKEKRLMTAIIMLGILCFFAIHGLYEHVEPVLQGDPAELKLRNDVLVYILILLFVILMISGKYFTDEMEDSLMQERRKLAEMSAVLKKMFGRYLSTEVMNSLIEDPSALELGGERRSVTIMMTDLRGFTALSERLQPEQVVQMLNAYFDVMVDVVLKYHGNINEIIGDALLIVFGAPQEMPDRARQAIACAIEMQNAMARVNEENRTRGLPELEMGIGLNETEVIVGNIGSAKRSKYAVVGGGVNMTSRIESYTVGGQILISESVRREAGDVLRIDAQRDVLPKGSETPLRIYEVGGIAGRFNLVLKEKASPFVSLNMPIPIQYAVIEGKDVGERGRRGSMVRLSKNGAEMTSVAPVEPMTNLKMNLLDVDEKLTTKDFYGKVMKQSGDEDDTAMVRFTSIPPEIDAYFEAHRQYTSTFPS